MASKAKMMRNVSASSDQYLSPAQEMAVRLLARGLTVDEAAERLGLAKSRLCSWMRAPGFISGVNTVRRDPKHARR